MIESCQNPRKSLNKAFLKVKPTRSEMESFKTNLIVLLDGLDETESEEHNKNDLGTFLRNTFYQPGYYINTKDRADLVIYNGTDSKSNPGVLVEVKKPGNKAEMIRKDNLKAKAFYELILYYLRERITNGNLEIKHLIATNVFEWFIFDAVWFEKTFAQNKTFIKQFTDFDQGRLPGTSTDFFYTSIAEPFIKEIESEIPFTWFDFREYEKTLRNIDNTDDTRLISLYKVLSPEHLLKLPFVNDSNTLDKSFYSELLHIIGMSETKSGSKKIIGRKKEGQRDPGSLIENTIVQLDTRDKISRLSKPAVYGESHPERLFNVSLELVITWLNRILFLKLLEAQLIRYHKGDPEYGFLNCSRVNGFDDLDNLFFRVLARKPNDRDPELAGQFSRVPYLNSSLFEPTELEQVTIFISNLQDHALIPILSSTVLKDSNGKKRTGKLPGLQYLFEFLDAYDFAGEGSEDIQEDNKTLINASVLGLIFEKINGYKDGSFFTPGFITMYMCRETIRRAVIQKFNETKGWNCETLDRLYDKIGDRQEANRIINSLRICDPAVGSGHFLVSALNEIIAIKSDLKILTDRDGKRLKEYCVEVANDELVVTDEEGDLFEYLPGNNESQRIQESLFHEKQTIIENCLFGVDINPNSVKICRLRLWIELLKNAYYKADSNFTELETLPNIDINIKCGNSLISRYPLDADIRQALKKSKWSIDSYRLAVMTYRNAKNKDEKWAMERLIDSIKSDFETEVAANDKRLIQLRKLNGDLFNLTRQTNLFDQNKKEKDAWNKKVKELTVKIQKLEKELEEIKSNKIYENAFEWRFEFPEVLNDDGDFVGFDVVIGNPPYIPSTKLTDSFKEYIYDNFKVAEYQINTFSIFIERSLCLGHDYSFFSLIVPNYWLSTKYDVKLRMILFTENHILSLLNTYQIFDDADVDTLVIIGHNTINPSFPKFSRIASISNSITSIVQRLEAFNKEQWEYISDEEILNSNQLVKISFQNKININGIHMVRDFFNCFKGMQPYEKGKGIPPQTIEMMKGRVYNSLTKIDESYLPLVGSSEVQRYFLKVPKCYIKYGTNLAAPRKKEIYTGPRLLVNRILSKEKIDVVYEHETIINNSDIFNILPKKESQFEILALLAIIASRLCSYYFKSSNINLDRKTFPKLIVDDLACFPIPEVSDDKMRLLASKAKEILSVKKIDSSNNKENLESEIDHLVYELYGLTEEEIRIVEGK